MTYLRLRCPSKRAPAIQGTAAANAVEHLLQQARSGVAIPDPMEQHEVDEQCIIGMTCARSTVSAVGLMHHTPRVPSGLRAILLDCKPRI